MPPLKYTELLYLAQHRTAHQRVAQQQVSLATTITRIAYSSVSVNATAEIHRVTTSRWLGSRVVSVLDSGAEGPGFKSQSRRCRVTVLGKLFTPIVPLFTKQPNR